MLCLECLESRCVPAASMTLDDGVLFIAGDVTNDSVYVSVVGGNVEVKIYDNTVGVSPPPLVDAQTFAPGDIDAILFTGGDGLDKLFNYTAIPTIFFGGNGNDYFYGGSGNDVFYGGAGRDTAWGNGGDDLLDGGDGLDRLRGGNGNNMILNGEL